MKVLIAYHSVSGNTRKVAEAIFKEIKAEKEMLPLSEVKDLKGYDLSFIGFPIHAYGPSKDAKEFLERRSRVRISRCSSRIPRPRTSRWLRVGLRPAR